LPPPFRSLENNLIVWSIVHSPKKFNAFLRIEIKSFEIWSVGRFIHSLHNSSDSIFIIDEKVFHLPDRTSWVPFSLAQRRISLAPGNQTTVNVELWLSKMILWYVQFLKNKMINIELFSVGSRSKFYLNIASYVSCILRHFATTV
jgi:hypothetical protein